MLDLGFPRRDGQEDKDRVRVVAKTGHLSSTLGVPLEKKGPVSRAFESGASRTRTGDLLGAIQALSQLSYSPERGEV
jgi:hypothetical protein